MKRQRSTPNCCLCSLSDATTFCACLDSPVYLCDMCISLHDTRKKPKSHELLPIATAQFCSTPGYKEKIRKRRAAHKDAVAKMKTGAKTMAGWRQKMITFADHMIAVCTAFRSSVETEMNNFLREVEADIEAGTNEFRDKLYEPDPDMHSPIAKAILAHESGKFELLTCSTNFEEVWKAFDGFLGSITAVVQVEIPEYAPSGTINSVAELKSDKRLCIYPKLNTDFSTPQSKLALSKFKEFQSPIDPTPTILRGPVSIGNGVYLGHWNLHHKPHGFGTYFHTSGDTFTGQWRNGQKQGVGRSIFADGKVHEGDYSNDEFNGHGKSYWPDGSCYIGEFAKNQKHGVGMYVYSPRPDHLLYYFGQFAEDRMSGRGAQFTRELPMYAGSFKHGNRHGKGIVYEGGQLLYQELK